MHLWCVMKIRLVVWIRIRKYPLTNIKIGQFLLSSEGMLAECVNQMSVEWTRKIKNNRKCQSKPNVINRIIKNGPIFDCNNRIPPAVFSQVDRQLIYLSILLIEQFAALVWCILFGYAFATDWQPPNNTDTLNLNPNQWTSVRYI